MGKGWEMYVEGQKLSQESALFRKKLDTKHVFDAWLEDITRRDLSVSGRVFEVKKVRGVGYQLSVKFDPQIISLFKEVRNMIWLNFQVPHAVANSAKDAKRVYPFAVSLMETCRTYAQTCAVLKGNPDILPLVAGYQLAVHELISKGIQERWDYFVNTFESRTSLDDPGRHVLFVREFAAAVSLYQEKVNSLLVIWEEINAEVEELKVCPFSKERLSGTMDKIQKNVDKLNLEAYANLEAWCRSLNERIEKVLIARLDVAVKVRSLFCI